MNAVQHKNAGENFRLTKEFVDRQRNLFQEFKELLDIYGKKIIKKEAHWIGGLSCFFDISVISLIKTVSPTTLGKKYAKLQELKL